MIPVDLYFLAAKLQDLLGGEPKVEESPIFRYAEMAHHMAYACDYKEDVLFDVLPDYGISSSIRHEMLNDELNRKHLTSASDKLSLAITLAQAELEKDGTKLEEVVYDADSLGLPPLPRVLEIMSGHVPANFRAPLIIGLLPILGALATGIRFQYRDGMEHSFSFMTCLMSPSSTGKSFIFHDPARLLMTPIREKDTVSRNIDQEYKERLQVMKNSERQPDNPHAAIRAVNLAGISRGRLLELMSYAGGKHLISLAEEIDSLTTNTKRGAWSSMTDILRYAFDNGETGQDFKGNDSFSGVVRVFWNLLVAGTPKACYRFFNDVEGGLVQRVAFVQLPETFGQSIPRYLPYTASEEEEVVSVARWLTEQSGNILCPAVKAAIEAWDEEKITQALESGSYAIDTLRRRSAVIGYRAGYLAALLNGSAVRQGNEVENKAEADKAARFAEWVAEYVFSTQMRLFGSQIERVNRDQRATLYGAVTIHYLLPKLPERFTREDLAQLMKECGGTKSVRQNLSRWKKKGWIIEDKDGLFKKTV